MVEWNGEWRGEKYCLSGNQVLPMFAKLEGVKLGLGSLCSNAAGVEALCWQRSMLLSFSCGISNAGQSPGVNKESPCIILRNTRWIIDPEVVSYLLKSYVFTLRKWFYRCKDHFKIHYVPVNDDTQWVRIPWACFLPVKGWGVKIGFILNFTIVLCYGNTGWISTLNMLNISEFVLACAVHRLHSNTCQSESILKGRSLTLS